MLYLLKLCVIVAKYNCIFWYLYCVWCVWFLSVIMSYIWYHMFSYFFCFKRLHAYMLRIFYFTEFYFISFYFIIFPCMCRMITYIHYVIKKSIVWYHFVKYDFILFYVISSSISLYLLEFSRTWRNHAVLCRILPEINTVKSKNTRHLLLPRNLDRKV